MRGKGRYVIAAALLALAVAVGLRIAGDAGGESGSSESPRRAGVVRIVPDSVRIKVEVLNASGIRGLARRATFHLRDLGFDVVASGNATARSDSTTVLVRSGRMDWATLAAEALGGARIEARPDSSRYLDLTILLGPDWRPPPEAFHP